MELQPSNGEFTISLITYSEWPWLLGSKVHMAHNADMNACIVAEGCVSHYWRVSGMAKEINVCSYVRNLSPRHYEFIL